MLSDADHDAPRACCLLLLTGHDSSPSSMSLAPQDTEKGRAFPSKREEQEGISVRSVDLFCWRGFDRLERPGLLQRLAPFLLELDDPDRAGDREADRRDQWPGSGPSRPGPALRARRRQKMRPSGSTGRTSRRPLRVLRRRSPRSRPGPSQRFHRNTAPAPTAIAINEPAVVAAVRPADGDARAPSPTGRTRPTTISAALPATRQNRRLPPCHQDPPSVESRHDSSPATGSLSCSVD